MNTSPSPIFSNSLYVNITPTILPVPTEIKVFIFTFLATISLKDEEGANAVGFTTSYLHSFPLFILMLRTLELSYEDFLKKTVSAPPPPLPLK